MSLLTKFTKDAQSMTDFVRTLQSKICTQLEGYDEKNFLTDNWQRDGGGGGITRVLEGGSFFDKAGVNTSQVYGQLQGQETTLLQKMIAEKANAQINLDGQYFFATGISIVIHPKNPFVPTTHMNVRYFELTSPEGPIWWYGGGADLTPYYLFEDDAIHFHKTHKEVCDTFSESAYTQYKKDCDDYFYLAHRNEHRGVGGIFFDYLNDKPKDEIFTFVKAAGEALLPAYTPILDKRQHLDYAEAHKSWQKIRRGRYVEFNLLYDKGTMFGLKTGGRTQSILMSLPSEVNWHYDFTPTPGSAEEILLEALKTTRSWM